MSDNPAARMPAPQSVTYPVRNITPYRIWSVGMFRFSFDMKLPTAGRQQVVGLGWDTEFAERVLLLQIGSPLSMNSSEYTLWALAEPVKAEQLAWMWTLSLAAWLRLSDHWPLKPATDDRDDWLTLKDKPAFDLNYGWRDGYGDFARVCGYFDEAAKTQTFGMLELTVETLRDGVEAINLRRAAEQVIATVAEWSSMSSQVYLTDGVLPDILSLVEDQHG